MILGVGESRWPWDPFSCSIEKSDLGADRDGKHDDFEKPWDDDVSSIRSLPLLLRNVHETGQRFCQASEPVPSFQRRPRARGSASVCPRGRWPRNEPVRPSVRIRNASTSRRSESSPASLRDHEVGIGAAFARRATGPSRELRNLHPTSRDSRPRGGAVRNGGASTNTTRSQRSSQPASSRIAASSTTGRLAGRPAPARSIASTNLARIRG